MVDLQARQVEAEQRRARGNKCALGNTMEGPHAISKGLHKYAAPICPVSGTQGLNYMHAAIGSLTGTLSDYGFMSLLLLFILPGNRLWQHQSGVPIA